MSGEQMLTVGRGLRTTATAAVTSALCQHRSCQHRNFAIYEARVEREARDTRTGLAAEPLVIINIHSQPFVVLRIYRATPTRRSVARHNRLLSGYVVTARRPGQPTYAICRPTAARQASDLRSGQSVGTSCFTRHDYTARIRSV